MAKPLKPKSHWRLNVKPTSHSLATLGNITTFELVNELIRRFKVFQGLESLSMRQLRSLRNSCMWELDKRYKGK